jgi:hypothetical protein
MTVKLRGRCPQVRRKVSDSQPEGVIAFRKFFWQEKGESRYEETVSD